MKTAETRTEKVRYQRWESSSTAGNYMTYVEKWNPFSLPSEFTADQTIIVKNLSLGTFDLNEAETDLCKYIFPMRQTHLHFSHFAGQ